MAVIIIKYLFKLKGKFPQTTMWIGWVESNFRNPSVEVWADLDNPFKRSDYTKLRMSPSLDVILPGFVISQEDNSPLTLYIDFHNFQFFLDINRSFSSSSIINACTIISDLTYLSIKEEGRCIFMKSEILYKFVYSSIRSLYCYDITDIGRVSPERATYTKLVTPLKNHISWLDYPNLPKLLLLDF